MTAKRPVEPQAPWPTAESIGEAGEMALASLDLAAPAGDPPAGLWAKIEQAMGREEAAAKGVAVARFGEGRWRQIGPGVQMKRLWDKRTVLLRCEPGARVPDHEHPSFEHALVLSGDLVSEFGTFHAGDYHGVPAQGSHQPWTTRTGCVVLVQYAA